LWEDKLALYLAGCLTDGIFTRRVMHFEFSKRILLLLALSHFVSQPALAQPSSTQTRNNTPEKSLTAPVPIPSVPDYKGEKTFQFGSIQENAEGLTYMEVWVCKDEPTKVGEWFKQQMTGSGWETKADSTTAMKFTKKDLGSCMIRVTPSHSKAGRTDLSVSSFQRRR
jgi:hypothetical protein